MWANPYILGHTSPAVAKCSRCGAKNPDYAVSCTNCGAPLQAGGAWGQAPQSSTQSGQAQPAAQGPVATLEYRPGLPVVGLASTVVFGVAVLLTWLVSGGLSYISLGFLLLLAATTAINMFGRNRLGLVRYEFFGDSLVVHYRWRSFAVAYSEVEQVTLGQNRVILRLRPGVWPGKLIVPGNPPVQGSSTLYEWLSARVAELHPEG